MPTYTPPSPTWFADLQARRLEVAAEIEALGYPADVSEWAASAFVNFKGPDHGLNGDPSSSETRRLQNKARVALAAWKASGSAKARAA